MPAYVAPLSKSGKTLHRVRVGPGGRSAGADKLAARLKARGLPVSVVVRRLMRRPLLEFAPSHSRCQDATRPHDDRRLHPDRHRPDFHAVRRDPGVPARVSRPARLAGRPLARLALRARASQPYLGGALAGTELQVWVARMILLLAVGAGGLDPRQPARLPRAALGPHARPRPDPGRRVRPGARRRHRRLRRHARRRRREMQDEPWWKASRLMPVGVEMASVLRGYVETGRQVVDEVAESGVPEGATMCGIVGIVGFSSGQPADLRRAHGPAASRPGRRGHHDRARGRAVPAQGRRPRARRVPAAAHAAAARATSASATCATRRPAATARTRRSRSTSTRPTASASRTTAT